MLDKMPGDAWQKVRHTPDALRADVRASRQEAAFSWAVSFGQWREWDHDQSLDWHLLDDPAHAGLRRYVQALKLASEK